MARLSNLQIIDHNTEIPEQCISEIINAQLEVYLPLAQAVDLQQEQKRIQKELQAKQSLLQNLEARLQNEGYVSKAPAHLIEQTKQQRTEVKNQIAKMQQQLTELF